MITVAQLEKSHKVKLLIQYVPKASKREVVDGPLQGEDNRIIGAEVAWFCFKDVFLLIPLNWTLQKECYALHC